MSQKLQDLAQTLSQATSQYLLVSRAQQTSTQAGDIYKAIFDSKVLGLTGTADNATFDVNSKAADVIFNTMDKFNFQGELHISVTVDNKGTSTISVATKPNSAKLAEAISKAFSAGVQAAVKKVAAPAASVTVSNIVTAKNVK